MKITIESNYFLSYRRTYSLFENDDLPNIGYCFKACNLSLAGKATQGKIQQQSPLPYSDLLDSGLQRILLENVFEYVEKSTRKHIKSGL